jgi:hypothetical protein
MQRRGPPIAAKSWPQITQIDADDDWDRVVRQSVDLRLGVVEPEGLGSRVTTITRVRTTTPDSRRAFLNYWRVIGTSSGVLRRTCLREVKARAEG